MELVKIAVSLDIVGSMGDGMCGAGSLCAVRRQREGDVWSVI